MSAEVSSFSKRAAAELSRCFNGISTSVSSRSSTSSSSAVPQLQTSNQANKPASTSGSSSSLLQLDQNAANNNHNHKNSMGTTTTTTRQTLNNNNNNNNSGFSSSSQSSTQQPDESLRSFGARSFGGAFRVFKNSEKFLSPLKSNSSSKAQTSNGNQNINNNNREQSTTTTPQSSHNKNATHPNVGIFGGSDSSSSSSMVNVKSLSNQSHQSILMTPSKQLSQRRPSKNGPPPKAPPKTNRARRKNYLLNLQKPNKLDELFHNVPFLRHFFKHFLPIEICRLSQVCKIWCHTLYTDSRYWRGLIFTIYYGDLRQEKQTESNLIDQDEQSDKKSKCDDKTSLLRDEECHNGFSSVVLYTNGEQTSSTGRLCQFTNLLDKWNELNINVNENIETKNQNDSEVFALLDGADDVNQRRQRIYHSIKLRCFDTICIQTASDNDLVEFVNYFKILLLPISTNIKSNEMEQQQCETVNPSPNHIIIRNASITDQGLEVLLNTFASTLHSFELIGCNELTNSGLWSGLVPNLSLLTIQDCINISDDTVATLCQLLTSLQTFQFQAYHVTDIAMAYFSTSMMRQTLRVLTLQHCWEITNQGVANVAHSLPNLTSLSLSGCSKVTDDAIEVVAEQLRSLAILDLSWCPRISDAALEYIACDLADSLRTLVLDRCLHVTDIGLGYLATMANLENLSVRWCPQIRDFGLQALTSLRSLRTLSIAGCSHVTITGLSFITRMRLLEEIELTNCPAASKDLIKYLSENLPESCTIIT